MKKLGFTLSSEYIGPFIAYRIKYNKALHYKPHGYMSYVCILCTLCICVQNYSHFR